jgi:hypothetical protein
MRGVITLCLLLAACGDDDGGGGSRSAEERLCDHVADMCGDEATEICLDTFSEDAEAYPQCEDTRASLARCLYGRPTTCSPGEVLFGGASPGSDRAVGFASGTLWFPEPTCGRSADAFDGCRFCGPGEIRGSDGVCTAGTGG